MINSHKRQMRTELARACGMGTAHYGSHHWWLQRITAIALFPLCLWLLWFIYNIASIENTSVISTARDIISRPWNSLLIILLIISSFHHLYLGLQVIVEDYIMKIAIKFLCLITIKLSCFILTVSSILAVLTISF